MRKLAVVVGLIFVCCAAGYAQKAAGAAKPDPAKGVRDAFDRMIEGLRQVDATKVMSVYDNNERTLFFNSNGTVTMGWTQMKKNRDDELCEHQERNARADRRTHRVAKPDIGVCFVQVETDAGVRRETRVINRTDDSRL